MGVVPHTAQIFLLAFTLYAKKTMTDEDTSDQVPFSATNLHELSLLLNEACADAPIEFALSSPDDLTCSDWLNIDGAFLQLFCAPKNALTPARALCYRQCVCRVLRNGHNHKW
jgi:hypothetical protein